MKSKLCGGLKTPFTTCVLHLKLQRTPASCILISNNIHTETSVAEMNH